MSGSNDARAAVRQLIAAPLFALLMGFLPVPINVAQAQDRDLQESSLKSPAPTAQPAAPPESGGASQALAVDEPISGLRVMTAFFYLAALGGLAFAIAKWKRPNWQWSSVLPTSGGILLRHRLPVSPQLTVVVVEVAGKCFLIASSPQAISMMELDKTDEK